MKTDELRKKDAPQLQKDMLELKKKLADLRFKASANQVKNVKEAGNIKKEIARIMTVINEKNS